MGADVVVIGGKRYIKPNQVAQRLGLSRATVYRQLPRLESAGVEVLRPSERVTLVNEADLESYMDETDSQAEEEKKLRLEALRQARYVRALIRERHGPFPDGEAVRAVREVRDNFGD